MATCGAPTEISIVQVISVIQIGDIHFPEAEMDVMGDFKDRALSEGFGETIGIKKKLRQVIQKVDQVRSKLDVCGLLICGDLTTRGAIDKYRECIEYLNSNMRLDDADSILPDHWHVVPGNHDVQRKSLRPNASPFPKLFRPLEVEWNRHFPEGTLTVERLRASQMYYGNCSIDLFSLNSCIGCGEWRRIPATILKSVSDVVRKLLRSKKTSDGKFTAIAEQLDAPAFHEEHLAELCEAIKKLDPKSVPIVLAHHNLLPQATPRLDVYTELLNSGMLRSRLVRLDRPVVYCHGHIHDDPVEVVVNPQHSSGRLVIVSAPEAVKGFNVLKMFFGKENNPLGLEIVRYRLTNDGDVSAEPALRISFCQQLGFGFQLDQDIQNVVRASRAVSEPLKLIRDRVISATNQQRHSRTVRDWLVEAEWHGLVELHDRDAKDPNDLRVRKVVP
jgi:Icc-related predicted phosphoesterase